MNELVWRDAPSTWITLPAWGGRLTIACGHSHFKHCMGYFNIVSYVLQYTVSLTNTK